MSRNGKPTEATAEAKTPNVAIQPKGKTEAVDQFTACSPVEVGSPQMKSLEQTRQRTEEEKAKRKELRKLRALNLAAGQKRPGAAFFKNLDSSIKKNTAVRKKLGKITPETEQQLIKELKTLNLTRYINEIVTAISTCPLRLVDVSAAVNICSLIHQHYAEFATELIPALRKLFAQKQDLNRKRSSLKFLTELYIAGFYSDHAPFYEVVASILDDFDKEPCDNLAMVLSFVRYAHKDILGFKPPASEILDEGEQAQDDDDDEPILSPEVQKKFNNVVKAIYQKSCDYMVSLHQELRNTEKQNQEIAETKGELGSDAQLAYAQQRQSYDKTLANLTGFADTLHYTLPELPEEKTTRMEATLSVDTMFKSQPKQKGLFESPLWDDEPTRYFYEDLSNLSVIVHPALLGTKQKDGEEKADDKDAPEELKGKSQIKGVDDEPDDAPDPQDQFSTFLTKLEQSMSPDLIDQAAIDFCYIQTKSNRKKLINALFAVNRNKLDVVPFYARLVATLNPHFKDIGAGLVTKLEEEFKQLYDKKDQFKIESKIKNIKFIGELTKFKVAPPTVMFTCLRMCLDDFVHHNIEVACTAFEVCGRFLYKTPETNVQCNFMLERMMRLKHSKALDGKLETAIENAYYTCKPPERLAGAKKEKSPRELYIRKLIYQDLNDKNAKVVMRKIRKLDWEKEEMMILRVLLHVGKGRFSTLHNVASLVSGLAQYHEAFGIKFIDALLEEIRMGLEIHHYSYNQKLILYIKFLGELYNYNLIEHHLVFDSLYFLLGKTGDAEEEARIESSDDKYDLFRIRLICTLLDTCGSYFKWGTHKKRLDRFLAHFQRYINTKTFWTKDVMFVISDTFEALRPQLKRHSSLEDAAAALKAEEIAKPHKASWGAKSYKIQKTVTLLDVDEEEDDDEPDERDETEADETTNHTEAPAKGSLMKCDEDDDFMKQLDAMVNEERDLRKLDTVRGNNPMSKPINFMTQKSSAAVTPQADGADVVNFRMLVKKGNKPKTMDIGIPTNVGLASSHLKSREQLQQQQQEMKRLVLQYDERNRQQQAAEQKVKKDEHHVIIPQPRNKPAPSGFQGYPSFDRDDDYGSNPPQKYPPLGSQNTGSPRAAKTSTGNAGRGRGTGVGGVSANAPPGGRGQLPIMGRGNQPQFQQQGQGRGAKRTGGM